MTFVQTDAAWHDPPANRAAARALLDADPPTPGSLVVLPEMFDTGFTADPSADDGGTPAWLASLAVEMRCHVLAGHTGRAGVRGQNVATLHSPTGEQVCRYAKVNLFALSPEAGEFAPWDGSFHE